MIKIPYILLFFVLLASESAWSQVATNSKELSPQNHNSENSPVIIKLDTSSLEKAISESTQATIKLDTSILEKTLKESIKEASEKPESKEKQELEQKKLLYDRLTLIATFILAVLTLWQVVLSRRFFVSEQRPWIIVDKIIPASDLDLKSGLSFTFIVKNVGKSPGMNVDVSAIMHLPHNGDVHETQRNLRDDQANTRKKLLAIKEISFGHLLIPGNELSITCRHTYQPIEYQKAAAVNPTGEIIIFIVGQVRYRFDATNTWHESGFIFSVSRKEGQWITLSNEITPANDVEIKAFSAGCYAT